MLKIAVNAALSNIEPQKNNSNNTNTNNNGGGNINDKKE